MNHFDFMIVAFQLWGHVKYYKKEINNLCCIESDLYESKNRRHSSVIRCIQMKSDEIGLPSARFDLFASRLQSKRHLFSTISWARVGFMQPLGTSLQPDSDEIKLLTGRFDLIASCIELANRSNRASCRLFAKIPIGHRTKIGCLVPPNLLRRLPLKNPGGSPGRRFVKKIMGKKKSTWKTSPFTHTRAWQALLVLWKQRLVTTVSKSTWKTSPFTHTRVWQALLVQNFHGNFCQSFAPKKKKGLANFYRQCQNFEKKFCGGGKKMGKKVVGEKIILILKFKKSFLSEKIRSPKIFDTLLKKNTLL